MESLELGGIVIAIAAAVITFGIARFIVRRMTDRRIEKDKAEAEAQQAQLSRQVRRANQRRKR